ncbi:MAG: maleylacetate reductase [Pseudomonadota bacterium]
MSSDVRPFVFPGLTTRVIFGQGKLACLGDEVAALGHSRALVLSTPHQGDQAADLAKALGRNAVGTFTDATMHTPVDVTDRAVAVFRAAEADCIVSVGGGSTIGLGKAIAARTGVDQIAIPTTYAGSEMTDILGETADGAKTTRRGEEIRPETVIYDVDLTLGLPPAMTVTSALNAIAHAVEALYAPDRSPIIEMMCAAACEAIADGLPVVVANPNDRAGRARVLYGAWLCSAALGQVSMALHHKLAHVLGGSFGTPHAETHAILLPHTAGFNAVRTPHELAPVARAFAPWGDGVGPGLHGFAAAMGAPTRLSDLDLTDADMDRAADIAVRTPYPNPRPFDRADIRALLGAALEGAVPA